MDERMTIGQLRPGLTQTIAYTGVAGNSLAVPEDCTAVRLTSTTDCRVALTLAGAAATAADALLLANSPETFRIPAGGIVSAIQVSLGGNIDISPYF